MRLFAVIVLVLSIVATGCRGVADTDGKVMLDGKEIVSVMLECAEFCKRAKKPPIAEKTFMKDNDDALKLFRTAIVNAEKMNGVLNYVVIFYMYLSFDDGSQSKYVLNVEDQDGMNALLVNMNDSGQGYTLSKQLTNELRAVIYGSRSEG